MSGRRFETERRDAARTSPTALSYTALLVGVLLAVCEPGGAQSVESVDSAVREVSVGMRHGAPLALDDEAVTTEGRVIDIDVLVNDRAAKDSALRIANVTGADSGWVLVNGDDTLRYHPYTGFIGLDRFAYTIADSAGATSTATVTVRVEDAPDDPVAENQALRTDEDTQLLITLMGSDADGDALAFRIERPPAHGALEGEPPNVTYLPDPDYHGADSFAYSVTDTRGARDVAAVWIRVSPVADVPLAADDAVTTAAGAAVDVEVLANDRDPDGGVVRVSSVTRATNGWVLINGDDTLRYQPHTGFTGLDGFAYTIADADGRTATAAVRITVEPIR